MKTFNTIKYIKRYQTQCEFDEYHNHILPDIKANRDKMLGKNNKHLILNAPQV